MLSIKILGMGCLKSRELDNNIRSALEGLHLKANLKYEEDVEALIRYGITATPSLIVDDEIYSNGELLSVRKLKKILRGHLMRQGQSKVE